MLKKIAVAMVAAGGLLVAAAPAHAGGHVSLSLGVGLPVAGYGYVAPTYYGPPPVVYEPRAVYETPYYAPAYPAPAYYGRGYYGPRYYEPRVVYRDGPRYYRGERHERDERGERGEWRR